MLGCELVREAFHVDFALHFHHDLLDVRVEDVLNFGWQLPSIGYLFWARRTDYDAAAIVVVASAVRLVVEGWSVVIINSAGVVVVAVVVRCIRFQNGMIGVGVSRRRVKNVRGESVENIKVREGAFFLAEHSNGFLRDSKEDLELLVELAERRIRFVLFRFDYSSESIEEAQVEFLCVFQIAVFLVYERLGVLHIVLHA